MKILITGGAGFIGSHIVDAYVDLGHDIIVVDNFSTGNNVRDNKKIAYRNIDINDRFGLYEIFDTYRPDVVSHHAALCRIREAVAGKLDYTETNILGTCNVLQAAVKFGVKKFIFASSGGSVYGQDVVGTAWKENDRCTPIDLYGKTKLSSEQVIGLYRETYPTTTFIVFRYSNVYGPRQRVDGEACAIAKFVDDGLHNRASIVYGDGRNKRDFVYISDVVDANLLALDYEHSVCLNIGTGISYSILDVLFMINEELGKEHGYELWPAVDGEDRFNRLSIGHAEKYLGWTPKISLDDGIRKLIGHRSRK